MNEEPHPLIQLLEEDQRYKLDAYQFVRESLNFAQNELGWGGSASGAGETERHLSGQQLCEASRQLALEQFGYMAKVVLSSWGVTSTSDFGEIVYNLIRIGMMKKSDSDRRDDFDGVYDFDEAFCQDFRITISD